MFVQRENDIIYIAPSFPKSEKNFEFSLAVCGNLTVCAKVENLKLAVLDIKSKDGKTDSVKVSVPKHIDLSKMLEKGILKQTEEKNIYLYNIK